MFDGAGAPTTQTFGLGMFAPPTTEHLTTIERFFRDRGAETFHEVSPLADPATFVLLTDRGYAPFEFTSVMYRPLDGGPNLGEAAGGEPDVRLIADGEQARWAATAAAGWSEFADLSSFMGEFGRISADVVDGRCFLVEAGGGPIATGMLVVHENVALFAGASTVPAARRRGAQRALVRARLQYAAGHGCDLAMICAVPGTASQRNAERNGFRIAYTRIKWRQATPRPQEGS